MYIYDGMPFVTFYGPFYCKDAQPAPFNAHSQPLARLNICMHIISEMGSPLVVVMLLADQIPASDAYNFR